MTTETATVTRKSIFDFEDSMTGLIQVRLEQGEGMEAIVQEILGSFPMCFAHIECRQEALDDAWDLVRAEQDEINTVYHHDWL